MSPINPFSNGKIPLVILGNGGVDVSEVDRSSLALGPDGAPAAHPKGIFGEDFDEDGQLDYKDQFQTNRTGVALGDTELCLNGEIGGVPFSACDEIRTVPPASDPVPRQAAESGAVQPSQAQRAGRQACGLGSELALLLPPLAWLRVRRRARRRSGAM